MVGPLQSSCSVVEGVPSLNFLIIIVIIIKVNIYLIFDSSSLLTNERSKMLWGHSSRKTMKESR